MADTIAQTAAADIRRQRPLVKVGGRLWEYRGRTPGGMIRLWAIGGGASLTAHPSTVTIPSDQIANVVRFDDARK